MSHIKSTQKTLLKKSTLDTSDSMFKGDIVEVPAGKIYPIADWEEAGNGHYKVILDHGAGTWFVFGGHWEGPWRSPNEAVLIFVPYLSQRDNKIRPSQTCNMTSAAMVIGYYYPSKLNNSRQLEDELTQKATSKWGNDSIYYHNRIVDILGEYGVKSVFNTVTPWEAIKAHLATGNPVIYSGRFTNSGHIIVLRGYDDKGFWVNDPWGEWFASGYQNKSGECLHYSYAMMERLSYGGSRAGWAHLCSKKSNSVGASGDVLDGVNVNFIKRWEGLRLNAYRCSAGVPTIGYGTTVYPTGKRVQMGDRLDNEGQALDLLKIQLRDQFLPKLQQIPYWDEMNVNQRTALASFVYNLGADFYGGNGFTTITTALKHKHWDKVPSALMLYVKAGGKTIQGLVNRRASEAALWRSNITNINMEPARL